MFYTYQYISLTSDEQSSVEDLKRSSANSRVISRCHAILLSNKGYTIGFLLDIFEVSRNTMSTWLSRWEAFGLSGLYDAPQSGRTRIFSELEEKKQYSKLLQVRYNN